MSTTCWRRACTARAFRPLYLFFLNKWYFDELYDRIFVRPAFAIGRFLWKGGDGAVIDGTIDGTATTVMRVTDRVVHHINLCPQAGYCTNCSIS